MINPYEILGLDKSATFGDIKKAYYFKAQETHPDKGGDVESFRLVKLAYDILKSKDKRKLFDEEGIIEDSDITFMAIAGLKQLFINTVCKVNPEDIAYLDIINEMKEAIHKGISDTAKHISKVKETECKTTEAVNVLNKRLKRKNKKDNFLLYLLEETIKNIPVQLKQMEKQIRISKEMLIILKEFSYKFDERENIYSSTFAIFR